MTFANLSALSVLAGLAGLAALLYALQHLRTRYREITVVTTLFWRQVVDVAPARTFRERFRHPWAYALVLAICTLIWLGVAEPQIGGSDDRTFHVLVLDGSAGMSAGTRFQDAVRQLKQQVARLPASRRQVLWSGAQVRPLLNPGEHDVLLDRRLEARRPEAAPATVERLLRQLTATQQQKMDQQLSIVVFGDAPVRKQLLDLVPQNVTITRATAPAPLDGNAGITALGVADAASGAWNKVDVLLTVEGGTGQGTGGRDIRLDLDGRAIPSSAVTLVEKERGQAFLVRDVPAEGGLFTARLDRDDSLAFDNAASVRVPNKPVVKVLLSPSLTRILGPVLDADPGVTRTAGDADVVIRHAGESIGGNLPALEFARGSGQPAFLFTHPDTLDSAAVFTGAVNAIGLKQIDATSLAQAAHRPIEVSIVSGSQWRFAVWEELLSEDYDFIHSRVFPLFIANAVRWLADTRAWYPYVAAGQPLTTAAAGSRPHIVSADGRVLDPLGADLIPAKAGQLDVSDGKPLSVSLLDPRVTTGRGDSALALAELGRFDLLPSTSLATWVLLLALGLLGAEWFLFRTSRIP